MIESAGSGAAFFALVFNWLNMSTPSLLELELAPRLMAKTSPAQFVRQVRQEISKISWATRRETGTATLTVFVMVTIAALFFLLVDMVLSSGVQLVLGLGG